MPAIEAISSAVQSLGIGNMGIGSKAKGRLAEKQGFQDTTNLLLKTRQEKQAQVVQLGEQNIKAKEVEAQNKKIYTIVGGCVLAVLFLCVMLFLVKRK